jgi:hypothetical protein
VPFLAADHRLSYVQGHAVGGLAVNLDHLITGEQAGVVGRRAFDGFKDRQLVAGLTIELNVDADPAEGLGIELLIHLAPFGRSHEHRVVVFQAFQHAVHGGVAEQAAVDLVGKERLGLVEGVNRFDPFQFFEWLGVDLGLSKEVVQLLDDAGGQLRLRYILHKRLAGMKVNIAIQVIGGHKVKLFGVLEQLGIRALNVFYVPVARLLALLFFRLRVVG